MPVFCSIEIIERMCKIYSVKNMKDLSSALGVGASTVSNWNQRNMIPFDVLLKVSSEKGVSLDWLVFGNAQQQSLSATEKMLLGAFNELDEKQQLQAVLFVGNLANNGAQNNRPANEGNQYHNQQQSGGDSFHVGGDYIFNQR